MATLFRKAGVQEDGTLEYHLVGVWIPVSFIEQRAGRGEEVK